MVPRGTTGKPGTGMSAFHRGTQVRGLAMAPRLLLSLPMKALNVIHFSSLMLVGSLLGAAAGCNKQDGTSGTDSAAGAVDSSEAVSAEGNLIAANVDGTTTTGAIALTGDQLAAAIAANITGKWTNGCAVVTSSGANITAIYNNCSGPRGLVNVDGQLDMTVSVSLTGAISIHATATDFQVNSASLDIDADATYARSGTSRSLTVTTEGSGTGPRGNSIDRKGDYTLTWDPSTSCASIDGSWSTDFSNASGAASRSNDVNFSKCAGACPSGSMTHHYLGGASLTLKFDGTAVATWSASTGASGSVALACH